MEGFDANCMTGEGNYGEATTSYDERRCRRRCCRHRRLISWRVRYEGAAGGGKMMGRTAIDDDSVVDGVIRSTSRQITSSSRNIISNTGVRISIIYVIMMLELRRTTEIRSLRY